MKNENNMQHIDDGTNVWHEPGSKVTHSLPFFVFFILSIPFSYASNDAAVNKKKRTKTFIMRLEDKKWSLFGFFFLRHRRRRIRKKVVYAAVHALATAEAEKQKIIPYKVFIGSKKKIRSEERNGKKIQARTHRCIHPSWTMWFLRDDKNVMRCCAMCVNSYLVHFLSSFFSLLLSSLFMRLHTSR